MSHGPEQGGSDEVRAVVPIQRTSEGMGDVLSPIVGFLAILFGFFVDGNSSSVQFQPKSAHGR